MKLNEKVITRKSSDYKEISNFLKRVFPKDELMPMWLINLLSKKKNYSLIGYYYEELFVGLTFTIENKESLFLFYLAVNDSIHSKGYGSKILEILYEKYNDKKIMLLIEALDPLADNYNQRVKRLAFYERNKIKRTGLKAGFKEPILEILSTDENLKVSECKKIFRGIPMKIY